jgi:hypothetical protein
MRREIIRSPASSPPEGTNGTAWGRTLVIGYAVWRMARSFVKSRGTAHVGSEMYKSCIERLTIQSEARNLTSA